MRGLLFLALLVQLTASTALAQSYPQSAPIPRTTSVPTLRAYAVAREVEERFEIGLQALSRSDWTGAAAEFNRIAALHPPEPKGSTAQYDLAIAYANLQRNDDAARALHAALALDPFFLAAMANLIAVDVARGDLREARSIADRYVALDPVSARALYSRGILALQTGDAITARQDFSKLLRANPFYAIAHYNLALAQERLGRFEDAERELQSALALAPTYARARFALGVVFLREGQHAAARSAFARATLDASRDPALQNIAAAMRDSIRTP